MVMHAKGGIVLSLVALGVSGQEPECQTFEKIYTDGKDLCETMWGDAFKYETDEDKAYTMWFFGENPNDEVTKLFGHTQPDQCHLQYWHKDAPGPESDQFTECHPWKDNACCSHGTVETYEKLKEGYGAGYHWDRCGPISQECERFFVQEACLYECEPAAGLFRKFPSSGAATQQSEPTLYDPRCDKYNELHDEAHVNATGCSHNAWELHKMPIKASYCDAWFTACRQDLFCATDGGNFFSCAKEYETLDAAVLQDQLAAEEVKLTAAEQQLAAAEVKLSDAEAARGTSTGLAVAAGVLFASALVLLGYTVQRERAGKPLFARLSEPASDPSPEQRA